MPFQARLQLKRHDLIVCVGTESPVSFFGYAGQEPLLSAPDALVIDPTSQGRSRPLEVLEHLADTLNAPPRAQNVARPREIREPHGKLNADTTARTLGLTLPENAIVVGEGISSSLPLYPGLEGMASHDFLTCKGGSIGYGIPASVGAAIATPHRRVITYVGDGSAAYTIQGLWTQARESLNVTTIVLVNRQYAVLRLELLRLGAKTEGVNGALTDIGSPDLDYVQIAQGFGVPAVAVSDVDELHRALERSFNTPGPSLVAAIFG
jgi:acetolactate synthase-1/2/3 large subunit